MGWSGRRFPFAQLLVSSIAVFDPCVYVLLLVVVLVRVPAHDQRDSGHSKLMYVSLAWLIVYPPPI